MPMRVVILRDPHYNAMPSCTIITTTTVDDGISRILGLPNLTKLRDLLASEPVVSNRRL